MYLFDKLTRVKAPGSIKTKSIVEGSKNNELTHTILVLSAPADKRMFKQMREAVQKKDHTMMRSIARKKDYNVNEVGGGDERTVLHTAVMIDDKETLEILLQISRVDVNVRTSKGLTPVLMAAKMGKTNALQVLLNDSKVNVSIFDDEDRSLEELINASADIRNDLTRNKARNIVKKFHCGESVKTLTSDEGKVAIVIGNSVYGAGFSNLEGAKRDLEDVSLILEEAQYKVFKVENSKNILDDVENIFKGMSDSSITHLHFHYLGTDILTQKSTANSFSKVTANSGTELK